MPRAPFGASQELHWCFPAAQPSKCRARCSFTNNPSLQMPCSVGRSLLGLVGPRVWQCGVVLAQGALAEAAEGSGQHRLLSPGPSAGRHCTINRDHLGVPSHGAAASITRLVWKTLTLIYASAASACNRDLMCVPDRETWSFAPRAAEFSTAFPGLCLGEMIAAVAGQKLYANC